MYIAKEENFLKWPQCMCSAITLKKI
jgi:hypothetical protein